MAMKFTGAFRPIGKLISREAPSKVVIVPPLAFTSTPTITGTRIGDPFKVNWTTNRVPDTVTYEWLVGGVTAKFALNKDIYYPNATTNLQCRVTATIGTETVRAISGIKSVLVQSGTAVFSDAFEGNGVWVVNYGAANIVTSPLALQGSRMLRLDPVASGNPSDITTGYFNALPGSTSYRVRVWARAESQPTQLHLLVYTNSAYAVNTTIDLTTEWKPYDFNFVTGNQMFVRLISQKTNSPAMFVDQVSVSQL